NMESLEVKSFISLFENLDIDKQKEIENYILNKNENYVIKFKDSYYQYFIRAKNEEQAIKEFIKSKAFNLDIKIFNTEYCKICNIKMENYKDHIITHLPEEIYEYC